jgi:hypothetical protein
VTSLEHAIAGNHQMRIRQLGKMFVAGLVTGLVLSACGGGGSMSNPTNTPTQASPAPVVTATALPEASVGKIVWATSIVDGTNAPAQPVTSFDSSASALYAVVQVKNLRPNLVLSASWTYNGVPLDSLNTGLLANNTYQSLYVQFHLARGGEELWPEGSYEIAISLDGQVVQIAQVSVQER